MVLGTIGAKLAGHSPKVGPGFDFVQDVLRLGFGGDFGGGRSAVGLDEDVTGASGGLLAGARARYLIQRVSAVFGVRAIYLPLRQRQLLAELLRQFGRATEGSGVGLLRISRHKQRIDRGRGKLGG